MFWKENEIMKMLRISTEFWHAFPLFTLLLILIQQPFRAEQVGMNAIIMRKTAQKKKHKF